MNTVEINNLSEPVEPVPMDELSIARHLQPVGDKLRKMDGLEWLDSALAEEQENTDAD